VTRPALTIVPGGDLDQLVRKDAFLRRHPGVRIYPVTIRGGWQALIPQQDGEGVMPLDCETPAQVAAATAGLAVYGLPADFPGLVLDDIAVLTCQHVTGAYRSYLSEDRLVLIAAGEAAAALAGPLQELAGPAQLQVTGS
jgi:hypothetical protein